MRYRVHLIGLTKQDPRVTKEFQHAETDGPWLKCWNGGDHAGFGGGYSMTEPRKDERWYPASGVLSVEVVS